MNDIDFGALAYGPHAELIYSMAVKCSADRSIQAIWVGGSLAAGSGDIYSDVDFRIAVEPGNVDNWVEPNWENHLHVAPCEGLLMRFGEQALLHHLVLADGTIVDFFVQDTSRQNSEASIGILACRDPEFRTALEGFQQPAAMLTQAINGAAVKQFLVDYWITTHKQMKALSRKYDHSSFIGLYLERLALLRGWYMQVVGKDIDSRPTLHMLGVLHEGLEGAITDEQHNILGLPSRTPEETITVIEAIRAEMSRVGRWLAKKYDFTYPHELEDVVQRMWAEHKEALTKR